MIPNAQISSFQNIYRFEHTYSGPGTYLVTYVAQSRNMGVVNISNSVSQTFFLQSTLTVDPLLGVNRSPRLRILPLDVAVRNQVFVHNPGAYDPDGDSLSFKLVAPKDFSSNDACGRPIGRDAQGYQGLENFLGRADPSGPAGYALNRNTGQLTWNTPGIIGEFALALVVEEWRNGRLIGQVTRDRQLFVRGEPIVTGLSEDWYSLVSTFPNPAASAFTLKLPPSIQLRASSLYTAQGTPVPLPVPTRSKEGLVFPIQSLPNALYFLHLRTSQGNHIQKIVVQR
ncbi:hypothetical protein GCM10011405_04180 [Rufibacter glacialis]|nr:hypothetical protein GCM10011405_04180 [Rufibacter glacialis]